MAITSLHITNFRNVALAELAPCPQGLNIISGQNGGGKTSLIEAIYYLGLGKSFRSNTPARLIRHFSNKFSIFAQVLTENQHHIAIGAERTEKGDTRLRMAESDLASIAPLAYLLPLQLINSQSHQLIEGGPAFRRKYLDWGLFYQSESFLPCWRQFERCLKQRNAVLRDQRPKSELVNWTREMVKYGLELDQLRREYVQTLIPVISPLLSSLLLAPYQFEMVYQPGWPASQDFAAMLTDHLPEEYRLGFTQYGPHRADFLIKLHLAPDKAQNTEISAKTSADSSISVKHFLSRGQQKLLICVMILAQGILLTQQANKRPIVLIDDLPAELDQLSRQRLISLLAQQQTQIFITAIENKMISELCEQPIASKVFHVKHGQVSVEEERSIA